MLHARLHSTIRTGRTICQVVLLLIASSMTTAQTDTVALVNARIIDGTGAAPVNDGVIIINAGRITAIGNSNDIDIPDQADVVSMAGKTIIPGLINAHGHVSDVLGLESGHYNTENLLRQLNLYASYGVTTVISLGGDERQAFELRDTQHTPALERARIYVAGPVLSAGSPDEAAALVDEVARSNPDFIKIRVDDNLGRSAKMAPEVYQAFSDRADHHGIPLAVHIYYLDDTRQVIEAGGDFVAHSVRDRHVDQAFADQLIAADVCYSPTLTREVSTYIYESEPDFFSDPFFLAGVDSEILDTLREPARQQRLRDNAMAQQYKAALPIAMSNLKILADAGVTIAMGTDSGPAARFQGYFEHLEMWMMQDAGLTPMQIITSATGDAAHCMGISDELGTLEAGKWADLVVLSADPLADIRNTRSIDQVWIAGKALPRTGF